MESCKVVSEQDGGISYGAELSHLFRILSTPPSKRAIAFVQWCHGRATAEAEGVPDGLR